MAFLVQFVIDLKNNRSKATADSESIIRLKKWLQKYLERRCSPPPPRFFSPSSDPLLFQPPHAAKGRVDDRIRVSWAKLKDGTLRGLWWTQGAHTVGQLGTAAASKPSGGGGAAASSAEEKKLVLLAKSFKWMLIFLIF